MNWQSITTAQKDGRSILLVWNGEVVIGYWHKDLMWWVADEVEVDSEQREDNPTHWMPLPPLPQV
jgi:Protein of unknown function (DUF551)